VYSRDDLLAAAEAATVLLYRRALHPMRYATLWDRALPRTSQRRTVREILAKKPLVSLISGGNRAGKTEVGAQLAVAFACGRDNPDIQAWAADNGLDISGIPRAPGRVWSAALTFADSRRYIREKLIKYLPTGTRFRNWGADNEAEAYLPGGGVIVCKSWDQGRGAFQGDSIRLLWADEEPPDNAAWNEGMMRVADQTGCGIITFTPGLKGLTWVWDRYVKEVRPEVLVREIWGEDNPFVNAEHLALILSSVSAAERAARARGQWQQAEGAVFDIFRRDLHVVPAFVPPDEWARAGGYDFGFRDPWVQMLGALDPTGDGTLHIFSELYQRGLTTTRAIPLCKERMLAGGGSDYDAVADSSGADSRQTMAEGDIATRPSKKGEGSIVKGLGQIYDLLSYTSDRPPRLLIHDCCVNLIREIENLAWKGGGKQQTVCRRGQVPGDNGDHAIDAVRYLLQAYPDLVCGYRGEEV